jgi:hypothetical protein
LLANLQELPGIRNLEAAKYIRRALATGFPGKKHFQGGGILSLFFPL